MFPPPSPPPHCHPTAPLFLLVRMFSNEMPLNSQPHKEVQTNLTRLKSNKTRPAVVGCPPPTRPSWLLFFFCPACSCCCMTPCTFCRPTSGYFGRWARINGKSKCDVAVTSARLLPYCIYSYASIELLTRTELYSPWSNRDSLICPNACIR